MTRWLPLGALALAQICYPLTDGSVRAWLVALIVVLGCCASVAHAVGGRDWRAGAALVGVFAVGGLAVEMLGVHSGFPFGGYGYGDALGPRIYGVPVIIPLAWTWMAWPAWLAAAALVPPGIRRIGLAGLALASWDLFLDPPMVAAGYWHWRHPHPALPGVPGVPVSNYLGWLGVCFVLMALLAAFGGTRSSTVDPRTDAPMLALYLWTYLSAVLVNAAFLGLPGPALWGGLAMGLVALPVAGRVLAGRVLARQYP